MGVNYGPKVVKDNLLLYLDMYNPNSYLGEPTENLGNDGLLKNRKVGDILTGSSWGGNITSITVVNDKPEIFKLNDDVKSFKFVCTTAGTGGTHIDLNQNMILQEGKTYTYSCYIKSPDLTSCLGYFMCLNRLDNSYIYESVINLTNSWVRYSRTITITAAQVGTYQTRHIVYGVGTYYITGFQIEEKSHVTPFVNGVRSAVDGWRDLSAYKRHFDISNPLFDNNGLPYFDGAITDFVPATCNSLIDIPHGSEWSINLWYKIPSSSLRTSGAVIGRAGTSPNLWVNTLAVPSWRDGNGTYLYFDNIPYAINTWINLTLTCDTSSNITMTYNGSISETKVSANGKLYIDRIGAGYSSGGNYHPFGGYVGIIQVYNRLLSPTEISQNFNALRGRFSV